VKAEQFDSLTREVAGGISRRRALRLLGGAVLGAALSRACVLSGDDGGVAPICSPPIPCGDTTCNCGWDVCCGGRQCCQVQTPGGQPTGNRCFGYVCCPEGRFVNGRCCRVGGGFAGQSCDICWQPSVLAPVFYGFKDFGLSVGAPVALRVFYPSTDGSPQDAPFLGECGAYPLVLFLHGNCDEANHYKKWHDLPAQLARSGCVVVVPELQGIARGGPPWNGAGLDEAEKVLAWMRSQWEHRLHLMAEPFTGIVGHSYGALLGGRLATEGVVKVSAYISLSGVWAEWPSSPPIPLGQLTVPSLFAWGQADPIADLGSLWGRVASPKKYKLVFARGEHWDYLPANSTTCGRFRGPCDLVGLLAADFAATFLSKYMPPERWPQLRSDIKNDLIPPPHALTTEQQFFAGAHLMGLSRICASSVCSATLGWETPGSQGSLTLPRDIC
jgi:pimeloyl-ACP methyl ester carboxylesterase